MTLDTEVLRSLALRDAAFDWDHARTALYATSVGLGRDPANVAEVNFVTDGSQQRALPSMATVMTVNPFEQDYGWQYAHMLHGEQRLTLHRPVQPAMRMLADFSVTHIHDKGIGKPALIVVRTDVRDRESQAPLFTLSSTLVARADGGFQGPQDALPRLAPVPDRTPDLTDEADIRPEQALVYRHNGDHNPLHYDPARARVAGFSKPVLHGLCTYGFACCAILRTVCQYDSTLIRQLDARFTAPMYAGDTLVTEMWQTGETVAFRCRSASAGAVVLDAGFCRLAV